MSEVKNDLQEVQENDGFVAIDTLREVCEVELKSLKGGKVKFYKELLVKDDEEVARLYEENKLTKYEVFSYSLSLLIIEWNFKENKDATQPIPITKENISRLPAPFTKEMVKLITGYSLEEMAEIKDYKKLKKNETEK